ncbi:8-oxo-(d)GTP phosphatase MutT1 [Mycolicibacterium sphagni]|uniref:NUDIX hydrolase n=1 Tax=Mycolicibacterium sphagni TaxID=1786 RepID=A0A255DS78_9MYCO|nr:NUDIX hydrolase [Mycolicibacterium sphagni]MCV7176458.1 NUDIX hydrolase [Mycolicibacterium sphagni]OYN82248.1 NUDIX hydrolase [Mycolicibacterium sphagni]
MAKRASRDGSGTKSTKNAATKKGKPPHRVIVAAGAVLWRPEPDNGEPHVALIHRPRYDDWSLPKGKVDPGENEPVAAVREIWEETGQRSQLGRRLIQTHYQVAQGAKVVHYWAARALGGEFSPGSEVDRLEWMPVEDAAKQLTYLHDREVLTAFTKQPIDTATVLIVRHGTAGIKSRYKGDDRSRPLDKNGRAQAESLAAQLMAFGATEVYAADRVRCIQTVEPLAQELGVTIAIEPSFTEEAYAADPDAAHKRIVEIAARGGTPAICTQGKVIPYLLAWWRGTDKADKSRNRKGSTWVLSLDGDRIVAADYIGSPLATKP